MPKRALLLISVLFASSAGKGYDGGRHNSQTLARQMEGPPLFCTEGELPGRLNCNLERIFSYKEFADLGKCELSFIQFRFLPQGTSCNVSYVPDYDKPKSLFIYEGSNCFPIDAQLKDLKISRASSVAVQFEMEDDYPCTFNYVPELSNSDIVFQARGEGRLIKYRFQDLSCSDSNGSNTGSID